MSGSRLLAASQRRWSRGAQAGVDGVGVEQRADLAQRVRERRVRPAVRPAPRRRRARRARGSSASSSTCRTRWARRTRSRRPGSTLNDSSSTARVAPYRLLTARTSIMPPTVRAARRACRHARERSCASPARGTRNARSPARIECGWSASSQRHGLADALGHRARRRRAARGLRLLRPVRRPAEHDPAHARGHAAADRPPHPPQDRDGDHHARDALAAVERGDDAGARGGDRRPGVGALPGRRALPRLGVADARPRVRAAGALAAARRRSRTCC